MVNLITRKHFDGVEVGGHYGGAANYGQGQVFLGQTTLALGATCTTNFSLLLPVTVPAGSWVTATATGPNSKAGVDPAMVTGQ